MDIYVSSDGKDWWSGLLPEPNAAGDDGPLATVSGALTKLRGMQQIGGGYWTPHQAIAALDGPTTVHVRGGRYELDKPIVFTPDDLPMTIKPYRDEKVVLSGGRAVEGWEATTVNGKAAWTTTVPQVASGQWYFKQLFVNGERAMRPRLPKGDFYTVANICNEHGRGSWGAPGTDRFGINEGEFDPSWTNITDIHAIALHYWVDERLPIASYDPAQRIIHTTRTSRAPLTLSWGKDGAPWFCDNVFEALTEPGEWYLNRQTGQCWYIPREGESIETAEIIAPCLHQLVLFAGDPAADKHVQHIRMQGLTFAHAEWAMPGDDDVDAAIFEQLDFSAHSHEKLGSGPQSACIYPGVIRMRGTQHCAIEDCTVEHVGFYGIDIAEGCNHIRIVGNEVRDTGCGAIKINGGDAKAPAALRTGHCRITDNHLHDGGQVFPAGIGILLRHAHSNLLAHNHIHDYYYSGISAGWVWGYADSVSHNNIIEFNHIHTLGKRWLSDMGGVYLLGVAPGTLVRHNHIHDIHCRMYGGWAIYPDEGSAHVIIENNVCYRTSSSVFHQHYGRENIVRNNIWAFGGEGIVALSRPADHVSFNLTRNIMLGDNQPIYAGGYAWKVDQGKVLETSLNLVWDVTRKDKTVAASSKTRGTDSDLAEHGVNWSDWQKAGYDTHSVMADPKFADPANGDFTLAEDSPALALGFKPIDLSEIGPRSHDKRD
jgi:hypothetical protein